MSVRLRHKLSTSICVGHSGDARHRAPPFAATTTYLEREVDTEERYVSHRHVNKSSNAFVSRTFGEASGLDISGGEVGRT